MGGIVWNVRTGNIVSGHQRVKALDQIMKTDDYSLEVEVVDLDLKTEIEQNIFMNSTTVQGQFDDPMLKALLEGTSPHLNEPVDYEHSGLDKYDLNMLGVQSLYEQQSLAQVEMTGRLDAMKEMSKEEEDFQNEQGPEEPEDDYEKRKADTIALKKSIQDKQTQDLNPDTYVIISFADHKAKKAFMERFGFEYDEKYIKGELFSEMIERTK